MLLTQLADQPGIDGVDVVDDFLAQAERRPDRDGVTKRVEEGQDAQQHFVRQELDLILDLLHIAQHVELGENDPLGIAGRSRGEDHGGLVVELIAAKAGNKRPQSKLGHEPGDHRRPDLVACSHLLGDLFQQDQGSLGGDLEAVQHLGRGQHVRDARLVDRGIDHSLTGRVVQVDGHLAPKGNGEVGHRSGHGGRHQDADPGRRSPDARRTRPRARARIRV